MESICVSSFFFFLSNLFVVFIYFPFWFYCKSGICLLIAPVPVHCFSITFVLN